MKKIFTVLILAFALVLCGCGGAGFTRSVRSWFEVPTISNISYDLDGVSGTAEFTYYNADNNKISFTSGEGVAGAEISFSDGDAKAARPDDGLEWDLSEELTQTLSLFGKLYGYAAGLEYSRGAGGEPGYCVNGFDYADGRLEVAFDTQDGHPVYLHYSQGGHELKLDISDIKKLDLNEG